MRFFPPQGLLDPPDCHSGIVERMLELGLGGVALILNRNANDAGRAVVEAFRRGELHVGRHEHTNNATSGTLLTHPWACRRSRNTSFESRSVLAL